MKKAVQSSSGMRSRASSLPTFLWNQYTTAAICNTAIDYLGQEKPPLVPAS